MVYGIVETTNYLLFTNPVSQGVFTGLSGVARGLVSSNLKPTKKNETKARFNRELHQRTQQTNIWYQHQSKLLNFPYMT